MVKNTAILSLLVFAVLGFWQASAETNKVVCYYGSWAVYRPVPGKFDVEQINPTLCTHLIYTFVGIGEDGAVRVLDAWNDLEDNYGKGAFKRFIKLKERNPQVKAMIAIGGWNEGSSKYSNVAANDGTRAAFVKNVVDFVLKYNFDGFDIDWEYPNQRGGKPEDIENYAKLIKEMRAAFDEHGLLLSAAVAAAEFSMSQSYDVPALSQYLDFINVMTYDLHGPWDMATGLNAPLNPSSKDDTELKRQLNVKACIDTWIKKGADPQKIILGLATYGRSFTLNSPSENGISAPANQPGAAGPYTRQTGMLGYNEIVELQKQGGWTVVWEEEQEAPYMYKGNQWVGYDDPKSIELKVNFAKSKGLGGAMIWSFETDDFNGVSGQTFPLLRAINNALGNDIPTEAPTQEPPSTTTAKTTTSSGSTPDPSDICQTSGYVRDPVDCSVFYFCSPNGDGSFTKYDFKCPDGLAFDPATNVCTYPEIAGC